MKSSRSKCDNQLLKQNTSILVTLNNISDTNTATAQCQCSRDCERPFVWKGVSEVSPYFPSKSTFPLSRLPYFFFPPVIYAPLFLLLAPKKYGHPSTALYVRGELLTFSVQRILHSDPPPPPPLTLTSALFV